MRIKPGEQLIRDPHPMHSLACSSLKVTRAVEQTGALLHGLGGQGRHQIFLGLEVLVDRAFRVLRCLGQAVHAQAGIAMLDEHATSDVQQLKFAIANFALFSERGGHGYYFDGSSKNVKMSEIEISGSATNSGVVRERRKADDCGFAPGLIGAGGLYGASELHPTRLGS